MPVTRSQTRKRAAALEINSQPGPEYFPNYTFHDLANDKDLQCSLYGKYFDYDLSKWPHTCWFEPKGWPPIRNFETLFSRLQFKQLFSYAYRAFNPHKMVNVKVDCALEFGYGDIEIQCYGMALGTQIMDIINFEQELIKRCKEAVQDYNLEVQLHPMWVEEVSEEIYLYEVNRILRVTIEQA
jgi:hypothetical protein